MRVTAEELFEVREGFPRSTPGTFPEGPPAGVDNITYTLDLAACRELEDRDEPTDPAPRRCDQPCWKPRIEHPAKQSGPSVEAPTIVPIAAMTEAIEEIRCWRCVLAPSVGQLRFFEEGSEGGEVGAVYDGAAAVKDNESRRPHVETSSCGRAGFWRERTPMVFGGRSGVGPLLMMPDTNILIEIRKQLSEVEGGLIIHPQWGAHDDPVDALREVVQLWWFRDVRFAVSPQHLVDSRRKPLMGDRRRAREDAVRELEIDFLERGGLEAVVSDEWSVEDRPCALHAVPPPHLSTNSTATKDWGWPKDDLDRRLVEAAYDSGCHVFLTADKGILKCHASLFPKGLAVMSPSQLLEALDSSGELEGTRGLHFPVPDLSTLTRLYAGFAN